MKKLIRKLSFWAIFGFGLKVLVDFLFEKLTAENDYVFDPDVLQEIANKGAGLPIKERWDVIHQELMRRYPGKISKEVNWTFNSAGNVVCQLALVYGSPTEYVAFFGTPIGESGFSGRYGYADVWDLMVAGKMRTFTEGQFDPTEYGPGDSAYLKRGQGKGVAYVGSTWMIDYGRGLPLTMLPFGIIFPYIFNTLDGRSARRQLEDYGRLVMKTLLPK